MKKCALFLLIVLVLGSNAWASLSVNVSIKTSNSGASVVVSGMAPCDACSWTEWCHSGTTHTLNVCVKCKDCSGWGCKPIEGYNGPVPGVCSWKNTVCVNVYCVCSKCCSKCGSQGRLVYRSSTSFTVGSCGGATSSSSSSSISMSSTQFSSVQ
jgi:hypothetical protein